MDKNEYNTDILLARAFLLLGNNQLRLKQVFSCELDQFQLNFFENQEMQSTERIILC